jgi:hypothetical protein
MVPAASLFGSYLQNSILEFDPTSILNVCSLLTIVYARAHMLTYGVKYRNLGGRFRSGCEGWNFLGDGMVENKSQEYGRSKRRGSSALTIIGLC